MNKYSIQISVVLGFLILCIPAFIPISVTGVEECTVSTVADKDTYAEVIYGGGSTGVHGTEQLLKLGRYNISSTYYQSWVYIHFDLTDKPDNWTKAEIVLYYYDATYYGGGSVGLPFDCINITDIWDEATLDFDNQPSGVDKIAECWITAPSSNPSRLNKKTIDISDHINYTLNIEKKTEFSIRINPDLLWVGCKFRSREYSGSEKPTLVWTYLGNCPASSPVVSGYPILSLLLSFGIALLIIRKGLKKFRILPKN